MRIFFFEKRIGLEIFNFCSFSRFRKIVLHNKNINKTRRPEIKKKPCTVLKKIISQIISQNFCKIELNPEKLEFLELVLAVNV